MTVDEHTGGTRARQRADTQRRILAAAQRLFAELGYERTTIRAVAAAARTDPGLVMRYFGSKQGLFDRVADMGAEDILTGDPDRIADRVLRALEGKLAVEPTATLAMLRSMLTHPQAEAQVSASVTRQERQLAAAIPAPDANVRAALVGAVTMGTVIGRHLLKLEGLCTATPEQITDLIRPYIRALMNPASEPALGSAGSPPVAASPAHRG